MDINVVISNIQNCLQGLYYFSVCTPIRKEL